MKKILLFLSVLNILATTAYADPEELQSIQVVEQNSSTQIKQTLGHSQQVLGSLADTLESIPGINNLATGAGAGKPVLRGDTGIRLPLLSNGRVTEYQAEGTRHNPNVEPLLMEKAIIIRGPKGLKYSSQSVKSAINLQSLSIDYDLHKSYTGKVFLGGASSNSQATLGVQLKSAYEGFGLVAGAVKRQAGNFYAPDVKTAKNAMPGQPKNSRPLFSGEIPYTDFISESALLGLGYQADTWEISLKHSLWHTKQNFLGVKKYQQGFSPIVSAGQDLQNTETQVDGEFFINNWAIKAGLSQLSNQRKAMHGVSYKNLNQFKHDEEFLNLLVKRNEYKASAEHPMWNGWEGEFGVSGFNKNQELISGHLSPSADKVGKGLYFIEDKKFSNFELALGARYDWKTITAPLSHENTHFWYDNSVYDASNNKQSFADWSAALGITYPINKKGKITANLGRSFRTPSIFELYAAGSHGGVQAFQVGNPNLKAETSINSELAFHWNNTHTSSRLAVYSNQITNYIGLENDTGANVWCNHDGDCIATMDSNHPYRRMINIQTNAAINGVEWNGEWQVFPHGQIGSDAEWLIGYDKGRNQDLALMPAPKIGWFVNYQAEPFFGLKSPFLKLSTAYRFEKKSAGLHEPFIQFDKTPFGTASTDDYWLWSLQSGGYFEINKTQVNIDFKIENLFNTAYRDFLDTYKGYALGQGRNFKLLLKTTF
jgi:outer membrane receptor protein involved in Fe transport